MGCGASSDAAPPGADGTPAGGNAAAEAMLAQQRAESDAYATAKAEEKAAAAKAKEDAWNAEVDACQMDGKFMTEKKKGGKGVQRHMKTKSLYNFGYASIHHLPMRSIPNHTHPHNRRAIIQVHFVLIQSYH